MVTIRNFNLSDADFIYNNWALNPLFDGCKFEKNIDIIKNMIKEWNKKIYNSRYFEQFVIVCNETLAGMISLYQKNVEEVSVGIYVDVYHRRKGVATLAYKIIEKIAREQGYEYLSAGVLEENEPSIGLHLKRGFLKESVAINSNGKRQIRFVKKI